MMSRRLFSVAAAAVAAVAIIPRPHESLRFKLEGVSIGIGPLMAGELRRRPPLRLDGVGGRAAVTCHGRFLGWLPRHVEAKQYRGVRLHAADVDDRGHLHILVELDRDREDLPIA